MFLELEIVLINDFDLALAENEGSDSDFSDKESDDEPMKEEKQEPDDSSEPSGLLFDTDNFPRMLH